MRSDKAETNAKWTSSHEYRTNYESIFKGREIKRAIDFFDDGYRHFQMVENRTPKTAICNPVTFAKMLDAWLLTPNQDGSVMIYGVKIIHREDYHDEGFSFA